MAILTPRVVPAPMQPAKVQLQIKWRNVILLLALHIGALYGFYLLLTAAKIQTIIAWYFFGTLSGMGITAGAHRLWSHRAYKAKLPLRILLMLLNSIALQNDIYAWCRDHRLHHKYSETEADPHNSNYGCFFSHMGWLMCKKHPEVIRMGKNIDCSDLLADPVVRFQRQFYIPLVMVCSFLVPTLTPVLLFGESLCNSVFICALLRYCYTLHCTWLVNSLAHLSGSKQYDKSIRPSESSLVVYSTYGEGYHNFHHVFPYDYSTSELDWRYNFNFSTFLIDCFALLGLAYDLRRVPAKVIAKRIQRTGDIVLHRHITLDKLRRNALWPVIVATSHFWIPLTIRLGTMYFCD